ncbi:MAG TPA: metalloregulator ArsR/SmtB family transcription factor [Bryobacteraceae bacterium]|jgi:ArsR family transcriptional regulator|nr:metalloregulator ArsR/SmtB family transcription factor [Bryobacteraceae bacterium]
MLKLLRLLADPNRLRMFLLLEKEELSVAELQEILAKGQSQISTHLAQLKQAGAVEDRRTGKNTFYRFKQPRKGDAKWVEQMKATLRLAAAEIPEAEADLEGLRLVLRKRKDRMRGYFDELAGRFGRHYVPGRSWQGLAGALLNLLPPLVIADLGAGEGTFSQLLAQRAKHVIAIDNSEKMVEFGADLARKQGVKNLEYRLGDLENLPVEDASVDVAFFSQSLHHAQHPRCAVQEAWRIVKPGGRIAVLDLLRHNFEEARELYADVWLGFTEVELDGFLRAAGFEGVRTAIVHKEQESPHFETLLAVGERPQRS